MSARASASAQASLPEMSISLSSDWTGAAGFVSTAMVVVSSSQSFLAAAFSPGIPAVISMPPVSRSCLISSSYCPRKRKPWERTTCVLSLILPVSHALYLSLSFRHISHWLSLSSNEASLTMVTQSFAGHTASQTPQPQHASMLASLRPSGVTSKQESGHWIQHSVHLTHLSKSITGRMVRVVNFLKYGLRSGTYPLPPSMGLPTGMAGMLTPPPLSPPLRISHKHGAPPLPPL